MFKENLSLINIDSLGQHWIIGGSSFFLHVPFSLPALASGDDRMKLALKTNMLRLAGWVVWGHGDDECHHCDY